MPSTSEKHFDLKGGEKLRADKRAKLDALSAKVDAFSARVDALGARADAANPFGPLPLGAEATWSAEDHQRAANYYHYEFMGAKERDPKNYKPYETAMKSESERHARYARQKRA